MALAFSVLGAFASHAICLAVAMSAPKGLRGRLVGVLAGAMAAWWIVAVAIGDVAGGIGSEAAIAWLLFAIAAPWAVLLLMWGRHSGRHRRR